ncbi:MAG: hypothetical protein KAW45_07515 [Thermoplasmatales archaeon]|nr:hypothetical protein [Thermoplasmatales archaeon]
MFFFIAFLPTTVANENELSISVAPAVNEGNPFTVTVTEKESGNPVEGANVTLHPNLIMKTNSSEVALFFAPHVGIDMNYLLTVSKEGYNSYITTIRIVNVPKIAITLSTGTSYRGGKILVKACKDDASPIMNAMVTFEGSYGYYYTDGNGEVTITAPNTDGQYTIRASFGAFMDGTATLTVCCGSVNDNNNFLNNSMIIILIIIVTVVLLIWMYFRGKK